LCTDLPKGLDLELKLVIDAYAQAFGFAHSFDAVPGFGLAADLQGHRHSGFNGQEINERPAVGGCGWKTDRVPSQRWRVTEAAAVTDFVGCRPIAPCHRLPFLSAFPRLHAPSAYSLTAKRTHDGAERAPVIDLALKQFRSQMPEVFSSPRPAERMPLHAKPSRIRRFDLESELQPKLETGATPHAASKY
jgi:hypothetical protein